MKLLAFSGKKQSGKDTAASFLVSKSQVLFGTRNVKVYYFGKPMKDFAEFSLGVPHELLCGTDEQKNRPTHIKWGNLPHFWKLFVQKLSKEGWSAASNWAAEYENRYITGRELLQQIGEEMFLDMNPRIWIDKFAREVQTDAAGYAVEIGINADPRKPEQIDMIHRLGGKVIRLLRDPYQGTDRHVSEVALDPEVYDQSNFDAVIDNRNMTPEEKNLAILNVLADWGWLRPDWSLAA